MKNIFSDLLKEVLLTIWDILSTIVSSSYLPIFDTIQEIIVKIAKLFAFDYEEFNKSFKKTQTKIAKNARISFLIYYSLLVITEIIVLIDILKGRILYFDFIFLFIYTTLIIIFSFIFVTFLNRHFKKQNFNYIIYFQLLFLLPIVMVYWIANIEGRNIYLNNLNSDQWISMFNTIIIYISGCLIGIVTLYKNKENKNETSKEK